MAGENQRWSYEGDIGPEHWGELFPDCAGREQSPVDVPSSAPVNSYGISFNYLGSALNMRNNGYTVEVDYDRGSSITVDGIQYDLVQFHFHAPSEHTIDGEHTEMEVHFVHSSTDGKTTVVGALIKAGMENTAYTPIMSSLPIEESETKRVPVASIYAGTLLPGNHAYYRYNGSRTTPPCAEGLTWLIMREPIELSSEQIAAFTQIYPNNSRPVQPLNDRTFFSQG